ncbi:MAG TPA: sigma-70 family RNA polymerase sigma factor [Vicinamibacterales bacterium]|nr:sigma-70 family RNA polymerase sigma factor [Vicinamibacterales bacterium]
MNLQERFAKGDPEAFELLFHQFYPEVRRWLVRLLRDAAAADDLTVEVFWRIHRARARFDPERSFGAWARRIASNVALDHLRQVRRARGTLVVTSDPPSDSSARRDLHLRVDRAFRQLPPKLRIVAELALIEGCPHDEIAQALGISRSAVKARAFRAMRFLKSAFAKEGIQP